MLVPHIAGADHAPKSVSPLHPISAPPRCKDRGGLGERKRLALSCPRSAGVTKIKHTLKYLLFSADLPKNPGTPSSISKRRYRYRLKRTKMDKYGPDGDNKTFACRLKHSGVQSVVAHKFSQHHVTGVIARKLAPRCYLPQSCAQGAIATD